jgi:hypothetical protein
LSEWEAYDRLEPIGDERIELYFASLCSLISNISIRALGKKGTKLTSPLDFVFRWDAETEEAQVTPDSDPSVEVRGQTQEEQKKVLLQIAKLFGGGRKKNGQSGNDAVPTGSRHESPKKG